MPNKHLTLSVHQLVDFLLRTGNIDSRIYNVSTMQEGSKLHALYQDEQESDFEKEKFLTCDISLDDFTLTLEGRADGVRCKNDEYYIEEIKTTIEDLDTYFKENKEWHLGQAKCYGYMFLKENNIENIRITLIYIRQKSEDSLKNRMSKTYNFTFKQLEKYVFDLVKKYYDFYSIILRRMEERQSSIESLPFPFEHYRKGQRSLAVSSYRIGKNGGVLFSEAPTGIGKTISTLYPFIKTLNDDDTQKIFYLTAKTSGKESAKSAMDILKKNGLKAIESVIQAKDKMCFCPGKGCNPDECPYTIAYYNKLQNVIRETLLTKTSFDSETVKQIALKEEMCPFELELDLSLFSDVIICDYNYAFDPQVYLKRYFDNDAHNSLFLVDEAHNLVSRSQNMYSAAISSHTFDLAYESLKHTSHKSLRKRLKELKSFYKNVRENNIQGFKKVEYLETDVFILLTNLNFEIQDINKNYHSDMTKELLDLFLEINSFIKICDFVNSKNYITYYEIKNNGDVTLKHFCLDASKYIKSILGMIKGSILFSATFSPLDYYIDVLGGEKDKSETLILSSPFDKNNLKLMIAPKVCILYKRRDETYEIVSKYLKEFVYHKKGNYFFYFPSYEYMENIIPYLGFLDKYNVLIQSRDMSEEDREKFINSFSKSPKKTTIGLAVIGGAFSEGIDLVSDRLIGAAIVGVGLAKMNFESDEVASYYQKNGLNGKDYAYIYPAINKITQAIGRVIRSENDKGAVLLLDERYGGGQIGNFIKGKYPQYEIVYSPDDVGEELSSFFKNK